MVSIRLVFVALIIFKTVVCCDFTEYHIVDQSRQELYPHDLAHPYREFMMHVWVPHAPQEKQYPLILFSHGLGHTYNGMMYTRLCQSIASQGYVVASVSHSYGCKSIQFPDGKVANYSFPSYQVHFQQHARRSLGEVAGMHKFDVETEIWVADMVCALNECAQYNACESDFLYNKIDLSRVGIIGHSLGGSTAIQMCRRDSRVLVAINLDGPLYGNDAKIPFNKPMLFIFGSSVLPHMVTPLGKVPMHYQFMWRSVFNSKWLPSLNTFIASLSSDHVRVVTIEGIVHDTFSDIAFIPDPVIQKWLIDGAAAQDRIIGYACDFLDIYLKGMEFYENNF